MLFKITFYAFYYWDWSSLSLFDCTGRCSILLSLCFPLVGIRILLTSLCCFVCQLVGFLIARGDFSMLLWVSHPITQIVHLQWSSPQRYGTPMVSFFFFNLWFCFDRNNMKVISDVSCSIFAVYPDGRVCISILHPPGEDPNGYELASERWTPVHTVCEHINYSSLLHLWLGYWWLRINLVVEIWDEIIFNTSKSSMLLFNNQVNI